MDADERAAWMTPEEFDVASGLARDQELTVAGILRQSLRLCQLYHEASRVIASVSSTIPARSGCRLLVVEGMMDAEDRTRALLQANHWIALEGEHPRKVDLVNTLIAAFKDCEREARRLPTGDDGTLARALMLELTAYWLEAPQEHFAAIEAAVCSYLAAAREEERAACAAVASVSEERADFTGHSTSYMHGWQDASQVIRQGLEARGEENQGA